MAAVFFSGVIKQPFLVSYYMEGKIVRNYKPSNKTVLKQVFDGYIEDSITDEQILRILEPVFKRIRSGAFDRPRGLFGFIFQKRAM